MSAIFDCGTPWISFHSFLLKSFGHILNVLIFDDCSQKIEVNLHVTFKF